MVGRSRACAGLCLLIARAYDAWIASGVGEFFAWKFRAAVLFCIFNRTGSETARVECLKCYRTATHNAWAERTTRNSYAARSHFRPRGAICAATGATGLLPIDKDIAAVEAYKPSTMAVRPKRRADHRGGFGPATSEEFPRFACASRTLHSFRGTGIGIAFCIGGSGFGHALVPACQSGRKLPESGVAPRREIVRRPDSGDLHRIAVSTAILF